MKYAPILLSILYWTSITVLGQPCQQYDTFMVDGLRFQKNKQYEKALKKYNAAKLCAPEKAKLVDQQINKLFYAIEQEKIEAERQRNAAILAQKQVELEKKRSRTAKKYSTAKRERSQSVVLGL